jgi:tetratricopeptide (TPR) repeat protein
MSTNRDHMDNATRSSLHNSRGIELAERGWLDEAIKEFKHAIKMAPNNAQGYDNLANVYADKGELIEALASYTKALSLEPDNGGALHNLGCFLANHGNQLALSCFQNAYQLEPDLFESRFNLGLCLAAEAKHEQALKHFEVALSLSNGDPEIRYHLALSLIELKQNFLAIKELNLVVSEQENNDAAWYHLGQCYRTQGFVHEAEAAYLRALKIKSSNIDAMLALASMLLSQKRKHEAKPLLKRAMQLDRNYTLDAIAMDEYLCQDKF